MLPIFQYNYNIIIYISATFFFLQINGTMQYNRPATKINEFPDPRDLIKLKIEN